MSRLERLFVFLGLVIFCVVFWVAVGYSILSLVRSAAAAECDCGKFAVQALGRIGIRMASSPEIVVVPGRSSYYRGVVRVDPDAACNVWIHEFVHHDQWLHGLEAAQQFDAMWWALENNARAIELRAMENAGECHDGI